MFRILQCCNVTSDIFRLTHVKLKTYKQMDAMRYNEAYLCWIFGGVPFLFTVFQVDSFCLFVSSANNIMWFLCIFGFTHLGQCWLRPTNCERFGGQCHLGFVSKFMLKFQQGLQKIKIGGLRVFKVLYVVDRCDHLKSSGKEREFEFEIKISLHHLLEKTSKNTEEARGLPLWTNKTWNFRVNFCWIKFQKLSYS